MFGEKNINGISELKVRSDKKIKLPHYSLAQPNDEIALFSDTDGEYMLFNAKHIEILYNYLKNKIKDSKDIDERINIKNEIRHLFSNIKDVVTVDDNNYISMPESSGTTFKCEGVRKHLVLEKLK